MNTAEATLRALTRLFVDDGSLALQIVGVVVLATLSAILIPDIQMAAGGILLLGCLGVLLANVARAGER